MQHHPKVYNGCANKRNHICKRQIKGRYFFRQVSFSYKNLIPRVATCFLWSRILCRFNIFISQTPQPTTSLSLHSTIHQKLNGTLSQRTPWPVSCYIELLDTQVFSGSVKRGSCGADFLDSSSYSRKPYHHIIQPSSPQTLFSSPQKNVMALVEKKVAKNSTLRDFTENTWVSCMTPSLKKCTIFCSEIPQIYQQHVLHCLMPLPIKWVFFCSIPKYFSRNVW